MEDHQFYNRERLLELGKLEFETYATLREAKKLPPREYIERVVSLLPDELAEEKAELDKEAFQCHITTSNLKVERVSEEVKEPSETST